MIDPFREPVLSLLLSENCPVEVLPLLQSLPISNINRLFSAPLANRRPRIHQDASISVLEMFLIRNQNNDNASVASQIAIELVHQGAGLTTTGVWENKKPWDILDLAFNLGHYTFVQYLLEGPLQHLTQSVAHRENQDGFTWLQNAVRLNDVEFAKKLLLWGVDCNAVCSANRTALFYASTPEMLSLLLDAGARVDAVETDKHGRSLSDHWNKTLTSVEVKKLNSTLFKSLKKSGSLDTHAMKSAWMDSLLQSTKGIMVDQQKKLKISSDFTWEKDNRKCSPMTWIAINTNTYRSKFQQKKIVEHFAQDPQHMQFAVCEGVSLSNLDALAFLETTLSFEYKRTIGWPDHNLFLGKWLHNHNSMDFGDRLEKMCTTFTHVAIALQSLPWVSRSVKHTAFNWYKNMISGRAGALEFYKVRQDLAVNIIQVSSPSDDTHTQLAHALQKAWEHSSIGKFKELAFVQPNFDQGSFSCLHDLMQDAQTNDSSLKNVVRAFAHETALYSSSYYTQKNMYVLMGAKSIPQTEESVNIVRQAIHLLTSKNFGAMFDDQEWDCLARMYQKAGQIRESDTNYAIYENLKALMERETIARQIDVGSPTPSPSVKRKM